MAKKSVSARPGPGPILEERSGPGQAGGGPHLVILFSSYSPFPPTQRPPAPTLPGSRFRVVFWSFSRRFRLKIDSKTTTTEKRPEIDTLPGGSVVGVIDSKEWAVAGKQYHYPDHFWEISIFGLSPRIRNAVNQSTWRIWTGPLRTRDGIWTGPGSDPGEGFGWHPRKQ